MPRVSIVVVTYNAEPFLPDLIDSLDRQTFRDSELIVVDNASSDGTVDLLRELAPAARPATTPPAKSCATGVPAGWGNSYAASRIFSTSSASTAVT